jgi:hypothetical protein
VTTQTCPAISDFHYNQKFQALLGYIRGEPMLFRQGKNYRNSSKCKVRMVLAYIIELLLIDGHMATTQISLNLYSLNTIGEEHPGVVSRMRINLSMWLNLISILALCILLSGCLGNGDNALHVAKGTHLNFSNMDRYFVELNMTDNNDYFIDDVKTDEAKALIGPPDRRSGPFNYTSYKRDIRDKSDKKRKLSLNVYHYNLNMMTSEYNLLELGLSRSPWDVSAKYESRHLGNYDWLTAKGALDNEVDAACWINNNTMLSLKMYDLNQSESLAILGSVTVEPLRL